MNVNDLNAAEKEQYKEVASELRCLVCQNQSLADSHASLAVDLKEKIAEQIRAGKTSEEIKSYMQDRYGEFVIYKPAYSMENAVLWLAGAFCGAGYCSGIGTQSGQRRGYKWSIKTLGY